MEYKNLNEILVMNEHEMVKQKDLSIKTEKIEVYFKDIEKIIIEKINKYDIIIGCVAWLTNENILKELGKKKKVLIIVQNEDFLRPDISYDGNETNWKKKIMKLYNKISEINNGYNNINLGSEIYVNLKAGLENGIRKCGYINTDKSPAFPRMHNKFIVCGTYNEDSIEAGDVGIGDNFMEVITGSFNFTENSNNSFENIVCIKKTEIVEAYVKQFGEIACMSMELDWSKDWKPNTCYGIRYGT